MLEFLYHVSMAEDINQILMGTFQEGGIAAFLALGGDKTCKDNFAPNQYRLPRRPKI
jgi:5,10-methylenetetrahydrofolate reductase